MAEEISFWGHVVSRLQGEIPAQTLEAYRRASLGVYDMLDHTEQKRLDIKLEGHHPWEVPVAAQAEILCSWNAYALQLLGDKFVEADYEGNPATRGYLPPITADQVMGFYEQVEGWMSRAHQAHSNPNYRLDVGVPAQLPPWSEVEPCPNAHLKGMLEAMRGLRDHALLALTFFEETKSPEDKQKSVGYARQLWAAAKSKADYAENLWGGNPSRDLHERIEEQVKSAVEQLYHLGQLLAMPELLDKASAVPQQTLPPQGAGASKIPGIPGPGEPDFDPWCLTDQDRLRTLKADKEARIAIARLWKLDPDPQQTLRLLAEVRQAFQSRDIGYAMRGANRLGHFFCCPWSPVYVALRPVTLGGVSLRTMQQFVYDVNCEGMNLGRPFVRRIMIANFSPTDELEYGDPDEAPDH
ncbi:MAG: hypothetical protein QM758_13025 [Armatimonas sp.]